MLRGGGRLVSQCRITRHSALNEYTPINKKTGKRHAPPITAITCISVPIGARQHADALRNPQCHSAPSLHRLLHVARGRNRPAHQLNRPERIGKSVAEIVAGSRTLSSAPRPKLLSTCL